MRCHSYRVEADIVVMDGLLFVADLRAVAELRIVADVLAKFESSNSGMFGY